MRDKSILPLNDQAITVSFGEKIDPDIRLEVQSFYQFIKDKNLSYIIDIVPTYTNVTIFFNRSEINFRTFEKILNEQLDSFSLNDIDLQGKLVHIPVLYDGEDLDRVAKHHSCEVEDVVNRHMSKDYPVYMIGFLPGFPYLGGLDERLITPRLDSPRRSVEAGSVGIANNQTGIYPLESPGGWNLIGRTPVQIYQPELKEPFLFKVGDVVKFYEVNLSEYQHWMAEQKEPKWEWMNHED
ncbi:5-oxoprolinase subunit PxpB [Halalkalibacillus sediminis]|uniref:5-oxoprolinase subunit PxpB n=1 Tax=Halalkalibacillus sediminis TaxID=2018042 RepID=UPI00139002CC|nr:5-oxoprolinase subunit PxpB [Halalkalibacillus sediminis]